VALGLKYDSIEAYLKSYGKYIVKQARKILDQKDKNTTGKLRKSLRYKVIENENGFDIKFYASKYAAFVNKGVSGTQTTRTYIDKDGKRKRSPFKFKKQPPSSVIQSWIGNKGIKGRDRKGRFITRKSLAFLIARSIKRKGIPAASFYTQPLSYSFNLFQKELVKNFKTDILNEIKTFKK
tara:strand:- start:9533 stop:10072 length:540 start_codon:yes stop_codon:yes gene_type:complete